MQQPSISTRKLVTTPGQTNWAPFHKKRCEYWKSFMVFYEYASPRCKLESTVIEPNKICNCQFYLNTEVEPYYNRADSVWWNKTDKLKNTGNGTENSRKRFVYRIDRVHEPTPGTGSQLRRTHSQSPPPVWQHSNCHRISPASPLPHSVDPGALSVSSPIFLYKWNIEAILRLL
jgi:hypothetical protein